MAGRSSNEPRDIEVTHGKLARNLLISETESWSSKMILFQSMQVDFKWCIWTLAEIDPLWPRVPALEKSITIPKLIELSQFGSTFQTEFAILDLLFNSYNASGARLESEIFDAGVSTKELKTTDKEYTRTTRIHNSSPNRTRARRKRSRRPSQNWIIRLTASPPDSGTVSGSLRGLILLWAFCISSNN